MSWTLSGVKSRSITAKTACARWTAASPQQFVSSRRELEPASVSEWPRWSKTGNRSRLSNQRPGSGCSSRLPVRSGFARRRSVPAARTATTSEAAAVHTSHPVQCSWTP